MAFCSQEFDRVYLFNIYIPIKNLTVVRKGYGQVMYLMSHSGGGGEHIR